LRTASALTPTAARLHFILPLERLGGKTGMAAGRSGTCRSFSCAAPRRGGHIHGRWFVVPCMKMIQLQQADGAPVLVNAEAVTFAQPGGGGTMIVLMGGTTLTVADSYEAVVELFDPERQAAEPC
jgi:uncharacterized protein YlzI (FlbEa/FlbD family)